MNIWEKTKRCREFAEEWALHILFATLFIPFHLQDEKSLIIEAIGKPQPDEPHGPVSERIMRHHYGASGYVDKSRAPASLRSEVPTMSDDLLLDNFHWSLPPDADYDLFRAELVRRLQVNR